MICFVNWKTPKKRTDGFFWRRILITAQIVIFSARDLVALFQETRFKNFWFFLSADWKPVCFFE